MNQLLRDYFFREHSLFQPDPHEVQINVHTRVVLAGDHLANRWIRIHPLRRSPGNEDFAHTPEDHVPVSDLHASCRVYAEIIRRVCC